MDDKTILKILSAVPPDRCVRLGKLDGATPDMLNYLQISGLVDYKWSTETKNPGYYRTIADNNWIRNYQNQERTEEHQNRIEALESQKTKSNAALLVLTALALFFAAVGASPVFLKVFEWLLCIMQCMI